MSRQFCDKHQERKYNLYCGHIKGYSSNTIVSQIYCDYKCHTNFLGSQNHFLDGSPAKEYISCDFPEEQTKCPYFKKKKWYQTHLKKVKK